MSKVTEISLGPIMTSVSGVELSQEDKERLISPAVGGVVLFAHNCDSNEQISKLTDEIHQLRSPTLLIAVDQEGGRVQRIKKGVTRLPPQKLYGDLYDKDSEIGCDAAEWGGHLMARELIDLGIDISFSPVLDVALTSSKVIGDRAFHSDPHSVFRLADSWIRGMQKAGMKAVGKHFPGHGGVAEDSHYEVPEDPRNIREVLSCDLIPYRRLGERLTGIMTAHVLFHQITSAIPTYSSFWIEHILREVLTFFGPVFSDDLSMSAAAEAGDMETRVLTALSSGCDIALICQSLDETDQAIEALMRYEDMWHSPSWQLDKLRVEPIEFRENIETLRDEFLEMIE